MQTEPRARRGWRERVEPGLYRAHHLACPSSVDRRPGGRCACPFELQVPAALGRTRTLTLAPGTTITEAKAERRRRQAAGPPLAPAGPRVETGTLTDFAGHYFRAKAPVLAAATVRNREDDFRRRIAPELGPLPLDELTRERIEGWLTGLVHDATSRRMIIQTVATLRVILAAAVEWGRLHDNPARRLRLPPPGHEPSSAERVLDRAQLDALFAGTGVVRTETILRVAGEAGLRRGELAGLRWPDLDLAARRLRVRRQVVQERLPDGGHRKVITATKGRRARLVALSRGTCERLADWFAKSVVERGAPADGYVWPGRAPGEPMHNRSALRALERACERAGLVDGEGGELVSLHGLRHTAASLMLAAGVPITVVSAQLGHANTGITATTYAHLVSERDLDLAAAVFDTPPAAQSMGERMGEGAAEA